MKITKKLIMSFLAYSICSYSGVFAAGIDHFKVELSPTSAKVGESLDLTIEAVDKNNGTVTDYNGTILIFSESDNEAVLPSLLDDNTYTFKPSDQGKIKFENSVQFKTPGTQDIHIYDFDDDSVLGIAEAEISESTTEKTLDISIISPEEGTTISENIVKVSGLTQKNYKVNIIVNGKEYSTTSNNDGVYEKNIENLVNGENIFKATVVNAEGKVVGETQEIKINVNNDSLNLKSVKVVPENVDSEGEYAIEVIANANLADVTAIVNDTITKLKETKSGIYTSQMIAPKEAGIYKIDVTLKSEIGHEKKELGSASVKVNELPIVEKIELDSADVTGTGKICEENKNYKITGLKLVELKTKSILTWDKVEQAESYNVYKKLENGEFELIDNVTEETLELDITGDEIKYDYFAVRTVSKNNCDEIYEGALSDATKVKTGPEVLIVLLLSLLIGGFFFKSIRKS